MILIGKIPGIVDITSDSLCRHSLSDSCHEQAILLLESCRGDGICHHTFVRDNELQFRTCTYSVFNLMERNAFLVDERVVAQWGRLSFCYLVEGCQDAFLYILSIHITNNNQAGILGEIPLMIVIQQFVA